MFESAGLVAGGDGHSNLNVTRNLEIYRTLCVCSMKRNSFSDCRPKINRRVAVFSRFTEGLLLIRVPYCSLYLGKAGEILPQYLIY